jgi:hypothetical protein
MGERERGGAACPACGTAGLAHGLCQECSYASAVARALHPAAGAGESDGNERKPGDDVELWDAWALLGDPGCHNSSLDIN